MKRILVVYYSQTGQLGEIVASLLRPISACGDFAVTVAQIRPLVPYPFPWPFWKFFNTLPECLQDDPDSIAPLELPENADFDFIILAYQVWFLSPSLPTIAFLQSRQALGLLASKPVMTVIGCRNMWLMAQERIKVQLARLGARLIDNVALTDRAHGAISVVTMPWWLLSGNQGPYLRGLLPRAGIRQGDIAAVERFGRALAENLPGRDAADSTPMLRGLNAVVVHPGLIATERTVQRSFRLWSILLRRCGKPTARLRRAVLVLYVVFLVIMLLTAVPVVFALRTLLAPFSRRNVAQQREYFAAPSGE